MENKGTTRNDYLERLNIVIEYIDNHLDEELELNRLSDISNFSPYHFHRIFKAYIGEPIGSFVARMRVETAARLLRSADIPVKEFAYSIGYEVPSSLTKVFRQYYSISPADFRTNKNYTIMKPSQLNPELKMKAPEIIEVPPKKAIYIRAAGAYDSVDYSGIWGRL